MPRTPVYRLLSGIWRRGDFRVHERCFGDHGPVPTGSTSETAAAALTCRGATCLPTPAPLTSAGIPTTCTPSSDDITTRTGRGPDRPRACSAAIPAAVNAAAFRRLPAPVTEIWDWQLWGVCRGLDGNLFFHPDHERGPARAAGEERGQTSVSNLPGHAAVLTPRAVGARALWGIGWAIRSRARLTTRRRSPRAARGAARVHGVIRRAARRRGWCGTTYELRASRASIQRRGTRCMTLAVANGFTSRRSRVSGLSRPPSSSRKRGGPT